ncbi:MAG TPA: SBBP repeat-containing protein [Blastocatellia bacterium]|nr:SBBP repeat-containing protein [Blastocatellia bacterium]
MKNSLEVIPPSRRARRAAPVSGILTLVCLMVLQHPALLPGSSGRAASRGRSPQARPLARAAGEVYGRLPLAFEANRGQHDRSVKFVSRARDYMACLSASGATLSLRGDGEARLEVIFAGANTAPRVSGLDELPGKTNYLRGRDPAKWRRNIPNYSRVRYHEIYKGIDVVCYGNQRELEYDFIVAPRAATRAIRLRFDGASDVKLDAQGDLILRTSAGELRQRRPVAYQQVGGERREVAAGYVIGGDGEVSFQIGAYDPARPLVIDPVLSYSRRFGGGGFDQASAIAVDKDGNSYITGLTTSADFPTANALQPSLRGPTDAFVIKLNAEGDGVLYSTFLGGTGVDVGRDIAVDKAGNAYVTGSTTSANFPTTPGAFQTAHRDGLLGSDDAFVAKLNASGNGLAYSTYLGGSRALNSAANDRGLAVAVDSKGGAYVAGTTFSLDFPVRRALQPRFNLSETGGFFLCFTTAVPSIPASDAFITRLNPAGSRLAFSTYFGGTGSEEIRDIVLDSSGNVCVAGRTCSPNFPRVNATQTIYGGGISDAFVSKLSASGRSIIFSTYLGGSGEDIANGVAVEPEGNVGVAGETDSSDLPTTGGALQPKLGGSVIFGSADEGALWEAARTGLPNSDISVVEVDPANSSVIYAGTEFTLNGSGLFKSTDRGATWNRTGLTQTSVRSLFIDPRMPSTLYAATTAIIRKSTDGGATWTSLSPLEPFAELMEEMAVDPQNSSVIYVSTGGAAGDVIFPSGLFKSTDGGGSWSRIENGVSGSFISTIRVDPQRTSTVYAGGFSGLFKSTDGGGSWDRIGFSQEGVNAIAIDPVRPSILYAGSTRLRKSTDGGATFGPALLEATSINALAVDPARPLTVYAATGSAGMGGGVFRSTDGGAAWAVTDLKGMPVLALAIDPRITANVYAGTLRDTDAFVAKYALFGQPRIFSTYLGHWGRDRAMGAGLDAAGKIYAAGDTFSFMFPVVDALQAVKTSGPFTTAAFVTKLDSAGDRISYSTFFEGEGATGVSGLAVDAAGKVYITGEVRFSTPLNIPLPTESGNISDAFAAKIVTPPVISAVSIRGNKLFVHGEGFDKGAVISIDGVILKTKNESANSATLLLTKEALALLPAGRTVTIRVRNRDGLESRGFTFRVP